MSETVYPLGRPHSPTKLPPEPTFAEIDAEEDKALGAVLVGMLRKPIRGRYGALVLSGARRRRHDLASLS